MKFIGILCTFLLSTLIFVACAGTSGTAGDENNNNNTVDSNKVVVQEENGSTSGMNKDGVLANGMYAPVDVKGRLTPIYFKFDEYNIDETMTKYVSKAFKFLNLPENIKKKVLLKGNADEFGSGEYNYSLGLKRANAVKDALIASGFDKSRIRVISYGESNPVCKEKTKLCWARNRRVEFSIK